jgi:O-antigen/teichoic acid export membrane protein
MRIGQTSVINFVSKVVASAIGFVGTIYFARELGASVLGVYSLVLAVVGWLNIGGGGITNAMQKRISEGEDQAEFFTVGLIAVGGLFLLVSALIYLFRGLFNVYFGAEVAYFVVPVLAATLLLGLVNSTLVGHRLVHVKGILIPARMSIRTLFQVGAVSVGFGLIGLLSGYVAGYVVVSAVGLWIASPSIRRPAKRHFSSIKSFAQYSWLGSVRSRVFGWVDILVLGVFVSSELVGIYSVSWTIGTFFLTFSSSINESIFPEISKLSTEEGVEPVGSVVQDATAFAGLFVIPGFVGAMLLGPRILKIYGPEFVQGTAVLSILVASCLFQSYYQQLSTTLGAVDRPEDTFRINAVFISANVVGNVGLVYLFGWVGAAVATALSAAIGTALSYYYLRRAVDFKIPTAEFGKQWLAALIMAGVVYAGLRIETTYQLLAHNFATVLVLVGLGAAAYFVVLLVISGKFRQTVRNNLPADPIG